MILNINTADNDYLIVSLNEKNKLIAEKKVGARRRQAEKLLPTINQLLSQNKLKLSDLKGIKVASQGDSFTSLRIGILTANALGFALKIPVLPLENQQKLASKKIAGQLLVVPQYNRPPNIG